MRVQRPTRARVGVLDLPRALSDHSDRCRALRVAAPSCPLSSGPKIGDMVTRGKRAKLAVKDDRPKKKLASPCTFAHARGCCACTRARAMAGEDLAHMSCPLRVSSSACVCLRVLL